MNLPQAKANLEMVKNLCVVVALAINLDLWPRLSLIMVRLRVPSNFDQLNWA